jgi:hypothetical protein
MNMQRRHLMGICVGGLPSLLGSEAQSAEAPDDKTDISGRAVLRGLWTSWQPHGIGFSSGLKVTVDVRNTMAFAGALLVQGNGKVLLVSPTMLALTTRPEYRLEVKCSVIADDLKNKASSILAAAHALPELGGSQTAGLDGEAVSVIEFNSLQNAKPRALDFITSTGGLPQAYKDFAKLLRDFFGPL